MTDVDVPRDARRHRPDRPRRVRASACPHEWFTLLRHEDPVHWQEERDGPGLLGVTRYDDVREVHRNPADVLVGDRRHLARGPHAGGRRGAQVDDRHGPAAPRRAARRSSTGASPRAAIGAWEEHIRKVTREVLDEALPQQEFDFVEAISSEIPMTVFARILGVPEEDRRHIIELGDRLLGKSDPEFGDPSQDDAHRHLPFSSPRALEFFEYGRELAARGARQPGDDIVTQLAFEPLTQHEFDVYFILLATAGNETTRHTISHGLLALLEHPDQLARAARGPARCTSTARRTRCCAGRRRSTTSAARRREDIELARQAIRRLDKVTTWLVSANRDETVFEEPLRVRRRALAEQAGRVRPGRRAHLPRRAPGAARDPRSSSRSCCRGCARSSSPGRWTGCGRTSSTASSGCRSASS